MFDDNKHTSMMPNLQHDVDQVCDFLRKVNVIESIDTACEVSDNNFQEYVIALEKKSVNSQRHNEKKDVTLTDHDIKAL